jgi:hypothetical protein
VLSVFSARALLLILAVLACAAPGAHGAIVFSTGFETGSFDEWNAGSGLPNGAQQDTGGCTSDVVRWNMGWSMRQRYAGPGKSGCRATRYTETNEYEATKTYTAWRYFAGALPTPTNGMWNLFQLKSKLRGDPAGSHPTWTVEAVPLAGHTGLHWVVKAKCGFSANRAPFACPYESSPVTNNKLYDQEPSTAEWSGELVPVRANVWTRLDYVIRTSQGYTGLFVVSVDGVEIFRFENVRTSFSEPEAITSWGITNYSNGLDVGSYSIYTDDVAVAE